MTLTKSIRLALGVTPVNHNPNPQTRDITLTPAEAGDLFTQHKELPSKMAAGWVHPGLAGGTEAAPVNRGKAVCMGLDASDLYVLDFDKGISTEATREYFQSFDHWGYSSHSYTPETQKHRVILPLPRPITAEEYKRIFLALELRLKTKLGEKAPPDGKCSKPWQPIFLPSCPPGAARVSWLNDGKREFPVDRLIAEGRAMQDAEVAKHEGKLKTRKVHVGDSVISRFNAAHDIESLLDGHGYSREAGGRWLAPESQSGDPGVVILNDGRGEVVYSHHDKESDPLADDAVHDYFDAWCILTGIASRAEGTAKAAELLGISTKSQSNDGPGKASSSKATVRLIRGSDVDPEHIDWLWDGWLAKGKLHIVAGPPGTGKTTIAIALGAAVTVGGKFPDKSKAARGNVLIWSGEDGIADTLVPRFLAAGADPNRFFVIDAAIDGDEERSFDPARDIDGLRQAIAEIGGCSMLIVDPIVNAVQGDSHANAEVRRCLQPLVDLGAETGCAIVGISHFSKGTQGRDPTERVTGSLAFGALARLVLAAVKLPEDDWGGGSRLFCRTKSNLGPDGGGFRYDLVQTALPNHPDISASVLMWGAPEEGTAAELIGRADNPAKEDDQEPDPQDSWLAEFLSAGPKPTQECESEGMACGFSKKQLFAARKRLGVRCFKPAGTPHAAWWWSLPTFQLSQDSQVLEGGPTFQSAGKVGDEALPKDDTDSTFPDANPVLKHGKVGNVDQKGTTLGEKSSFEAGDTDPTSPSSQGSNPLSRRAEKLHQYLEARPNGVTRSDAIHGCFSGNLNKAKLDAVINELVGAGIALTEETTVRGKASMMLKLAPATVQQTGPTTAEVKGMIQAATTARKIREKQKATIERKHREPRPPIQESQEDAELRESLTAALGDDEGEDG